MLCRHLRYTTRCHPTWLLKMRSRTAAGYVLPGNVQARAVPRRWYLVLNQYGCCATSRNRNVQSFQALNCATVFFLDNAGIACVCTFRHCSFSALNGRQSSKNASESRAFSWSWHSAHPVVSSHPNAELLRVNDHACVL
jgi:hypothetical protein